MEQQEALTETAAATPPRLQKMQRAHFLRGCPQYGTYIRDRTIVLPSHDTDSDGNLLVYRGAVYCRFPNCSRRIEPFSRTTNLRAHLKGHGQACAKGWSGRLSQQKKDTAIAFFVSLFQ
ncbi:hypothetical protein N7520_001929 [Penicillium odoratum]|uniref:uncharacterized protein n=1 Tax=Penicillium odoratum TaxID=1167516 RepID=UPI002549227C|nr:uncharacterized protein N7520_001929 [Penicillium odoratum]KAJ5778683.1 hypothetical protein N7520_001929 [Penicillium odoratum]